MRTNFSKNILSIILTIFPMSDLAKSERLQIFNFDTYVNAGARYIRLISIINNKIKIHVHSVVSRQLFIIRGGVTWPSPPSLRRARDGGRWQRCRQSAVVLGSCRQRCAVLWVVVVVVIVTAQCATFARPTHPMFVFSSSSWYVRSSSSSSRANQCNTLARARAPTILERRADGACSYRRCDVVGITVGSRDVDDDEDHEIRRRWVLSAARGSPASRCSLARPALSWLPLALATHFRPVKSAAHQGKRARTNSRCKIAQPIAMLGCDLLRAQFRPKKPSRRATLEILAMDAHFSVRRRVCVYMHACALRCVRARVATCVPFMHWSCARVVKSALDKPERFCAHSHDRLLWHGSLWFLHLYPRFCRDNGIDSETISDNGISELPNATPFS